MRLTRPMLCGGVIAITAAAVAPVGEAHKPITSPFTYNEDVFPILRERCGSCHVTGGVAPMSLMTHVEAVPWAESMRAELVAGHMPPWPVETARDRFRDAGALTARELNILLTWATGGTPPGDPAKTPPPVTLNTTWPLGAPDLELPLPAVTVRAEEQERVESFVIATGTNRARRVRAVDLLPGNVAIVRRAEVSIREAEGPPRNTASAVAGPVDSSPDRHLALWIAGEAPVALDSGLGFELPAGAELAIRVHYKKTWQYERKEMQDRSRVGIYFARDDASVVRSITLRGDTATGTPPRALASAVGGFATSLPRPGTPVKILAIYPDPEMANVRASVEILGTGRSHHEVFTMHAEPAWPRRYWFKDPIVVAAGGGLSARFQPDAGAAALTPRAITLDVVEP